MACDVMTWDGAIETDVDGVIPADVARVEKD